MKLLHPYVDIVPGRPGMRPATSILSEAQIIPGSAVVRLINTTAQENAYTIKLRCEEPYWQEEWYSIISLPPDPSKGENAPPTGKPDVRGPQDRWVRIFVPRGGTRDVLIRFNVPQRPDSRARRYQYQIEIETQIVTQGPAARRRDRVTTLSGTATVQPFYKWSLDISPEDHRAGTFRHVGHYEIVVTNESNDWLYCDLKAGRRKEIIVETPTVRAAVPPPEPGETITAGPEGGSRNGVQRTIPLKAVCKLRVFRGNITPLQLPISAVRVDAPSVTPVFEEGASPGSRPVVANVTSETAAPPQDRRLTYYPPIPNNVMDFFNHSGSTIRGFVLMIAGAVLLIPMLYIMYENVFHNNILVEPMALTTTAGQKLKIRGNWLQGALLQVTDGKAQPTTVDAKLATITDLNEYYIVMPAQYDHEQVKIRAQRFARWLPAFLANTLPAYTSISSVQVGTVVVPTVIKPAEVTQLAAGSAKPGQTFSIGGSDMGTGGIILMNGAGFSASSWTPTKIVAAVPGTQPAGQMIVEIEPIGAAAPLPAGTIQVLPLPGQSVTPTAAPAAPTPGGALPSVQPAVVPVTPRPAVPTTPVATSPAIQPSMPVQPSTPAATPVATNPTPAPRHPKKRPRLTSSPQPKMPTSSNLAPPPPGLTPKQQLGEQIDAQRTALQTEQVNMNTLITQRNNLYNQVNTQQGSVDLHNKQAVAAYNALVAQANDANHTANDAINKYKQDSDNFNAMVSRYNGMQ